MPIKTVRLIFHVMQKDDGSENWQERTRDGGVDEAILRGYINGVVWPQAGQPGSAPARGVNGLFTLLDERITATGTAITSAQPPYADTRIRFQLDAIRYYRSSYYWNMSNSAPAGCEGGGCMGALYDTFVTNSANNPGITGQLQLTPEQKNNVIHVFFGENPGPPGAPLDQFGNSVSRYGTGGAAGSIPSKLIMMRGHYWSLRNHPYWAPGQPTNAGNQQQSFIYSSYVMAHELGHCLGLTHTFGGGCISSGANDPPAAAEGESNNIMDYPKYPGASLSQCQIGAMHDALSSTFVDDAQIRDHWTRWAGPAQDNIITQSQTWSTIHNLRGNLYVEPGAVLTVRCRIGMLGPTAKIVVRRGGQLIFDGGSLGNYATSSVNEAPQSLLIRLGGDPNDPNDANRTGLIEFRNAGCQLTSTRMRAELTARATLHLAGTARLQVSGASLQTLAGSYFCLEPTARLSRAAGGSYAIAADTTLGIGPNVGVVITPAPACVTNLCAVSSQELGIAGSIAENTPFCPNTGPVTLTVTGLPTPLPGGYAYQWLLDGTPLAGHVGATLTHSLPDNTGTANLTRVYSCRVQPPPGCPAVLLSYSVVLKPWAAGIPVPVTTATRCVAAPYGYYNLAGLVPTVFASTTSPGTVTWSGTHVTYYGVVAGRGAGAGGGGGGGGTGPYYLFNVAAALQTGATQFTIYVSAQPTAPGGRCPTPTAITFILAPTPTLTVSTTFPTTCPANPTGTRLTATVAAGTTVRWQPGNLTGTSVLVFPAATTTYTATATNSAGCTNQKTLTLNVLPATCPVCEPDVVQMNPVQFGTPVTTYGNGYTFLSGTTYYFSANTTFKAGDFVAQPNARLLFGAGISLTLTGNARMELNGATLTATCNEQWSGITVQSLSGFVARSPTGIANEISHSTNGIVLTGDPYRVYNIEIGKTRAWSPLSLTGVRFKNNLRGVQLLQGSGGDRQVVISGCTFEADPQQMRAPYAYVSATTQWCSYAHISLFSNGASPFGNVESITLDNNVFSGALFGLWAPTAPGIRTYGNTFRNCYIAGAFNLLNTRASTWNTNTFNLSVPINDFINPANPFVAGAYAAIAALGAVPREVSYPGNAVGLCASGEPLTVSGNQFLQPTGLGSYTWDVPAPQTGLWAGPGTVALRNNVFQNLHVGAVEQAQQPAGGVAEGNTFVGCRTGLSFLNRNANAAPGDVKLTCNSFERPANVAGTSFSIYLGPGPYVAGQLGRQVNIAEEFLPLSNRYVPYLQTNRFIGVSPPYNPNNIQIFWHVCNEGDNAPFAYTRYNASADPNPNNAVAVVGDATMVTGVSFPPRLVQLLPNVNDCASRRYPAGVGLRSAPTPAIEPNRASAYLAQNVPNPCTGSTSITYRTAPGSPAALVVRDAFGRVWLRQEVAAGEHTVVLHLEKLPPGAYHYSLDVAGRPLAHHQLLVQ